MIRPDKDGRLAERLREIALLEKDSLVGEGANKVWLYSETKSFILNVAADLLEEYILERNALNTLGGKDGSNP